MLKNHYAAKILNKMKKPYLSPELKKVENKQPLFEKLLLNFAKKVDKEPELEFLHDFFKEFPQSNIYLVGGMVRDAALGVKKMAKDFDFVANNIDLDKLINFLEQRGSVDLVGRNFGVLKFMPTDSKLTEPIDIALPRTETAGGSGGYRDFNVQSDPKLKIEDDLSRRDFTINAMALDIKNGKIIDPYTGLADLANGELKAVLNPEERFTEDYSRMLRALRFATRFNFKIEDKTWQAITKLAPNINETRKINKKSERIVPTETIAKEFLKTLELNPIKCLELYKQSGFLKELLPELLELQQCEQPKEFHSEGNAWEHTVLALKNAISPEFKAEFGQNPPLEVLIAILLHDIAKPQTAKHEAKQNRIMFIHHEQQGAELAQTICERLTLPSYQGKVKTENIAWLIGNHMISKSDKANIKATKLEKIFFKDPELGKELMMLCFCDDFASLTPRGPNNEGYESLKKRLQELKDLGTKKDALPSPLLNGDEIMQKFGLKPGKQIGVLMNLIREAQLNGQIENPTQAIELIKKELEEKNN